jgi:hypothetical protein
MVANEAVDIHTNDRRNAHVHAIGPMTGCAFLREVPPIIGQLRIVSEGVAAES